MNVNKKSMSKRHKVLNQLGYVTPMRGARMWMHPSEDVEDEIAQYLGPSALSSTDRRRALKRKDERRKCSAEYPKNCTPVKYPPCDASVCLAACMPKLSNILNRIYTKYGHYRFMSSDYGEFGNDGFLVCAKDINEPIAFLNGAQDTSVSDACKILHTYASPELSVYAIAYTDEKHRQNLSYFSLRPDPLRSPKVGQINRIFNDIHALFPNEKASKFVYRVLSYQNWYPSRTCFVYVKILSCSLTTEICH